MTGREITSVISAISLGGNDTDSSLKFGRVNKQVVVNHMNV
jgi:hypothetical protein